MNTMIDAITTPGNPALGMPEVSKSHADKLTFNTREEYLDWVKHWKEDYKIISTEQTRQKLNRFTLPKNIEFAKKKTEKLDAISSPEKYKEAKARLLARIMTEYGKNADYGYSCINPILARYLLVVRRAGKLRAASKRAERIAALK